MKTMTETNERLEFGDPWSSSRCRTTAWRYPDQDGRFFKAARASQRQHAPRLSVAVGLPSWLVLPQQGTCARINVQEDVLEAFMGRGTRTFDSALRL
jgi:hypothetical protein